MLSKSNFSRRHIDELHRRYPKVTESVFEMSMYAFGLLELLADSRLDFIFKAKCTKPHQFPRKRNVMCR